MFNQIKGTAMGASFAAFYACLTIGFLEETQLYPKLQSKFGTDIMEQIKKAYKRFMDDGIVFLPEHIDKDQFLSILNDMDPAIIFTLEESESITFKGRKVEKLNFLDISIIIDEEGFIYTDVYYKPTNSHDYLHFGSFHPDHTIQNIPYNLAKRIIVFCSDEEVMEGRLIELENLLKQCDYPVETIRKGFHNARLQGPANKKTKKDDIMAFVHQNMSNYKFSHIISNAKTLFENARSDEIRHIFKDTRFVEAMRQPKNIIRTLTTTKRQQNVEIEPKPGMVTCTDSRCELCSLGYIEEYTSLTTSSGKVWEIKSHINCNSRNVLYYLECLFCNEITKTGKTKTRLRERLNNHRSECGTGRTTDVFDKHCHECGAHTLQEPYFRVRAFMKLSTPEKLFTYEKMLHERKYATINT